MAINAGDWTHSQLQDKVLDAASDVWQNLRSTPNYDEDIQALRRILGTQTVKFNDWQRFNNPDRTCVVPGAYWKGDCGTPTAVDCGDPSLEACDIGGTETGGTNSEMYDQNYCKSIEFTVNALDCGGDITSTSTRIADELTKTMKAHALTLKNWIIAQVYANASTGLVPNSHASILTPDAGNAFFTASIDDFKNPLLKALVWQAKKNYMNNPVILTEQNFWDSFFDMRYANENCCDDFGALRTTPIPISFVDSGLDDLAASGNNLSLVLDADRYGFFNSYTFENTAPQSRPGDAAVFRAPLLDIQYSNGGKSQTIWVDVSTVEKCIDRSKDQYSYAYRTTVSGGFHMAPDLCDEGYAKVIAIEATA